MGFDIGFEDRSSTFESMEAEELVGNEFKIARAQEGDELAKKGNERGGPGTTWSPPLVLI
jgi:hypothetical protein